jgi:hypothetical protein
MKINPLPPLAYVQECLSLDHETGVLTWKERPPHHFKNPDPSYGYLCWNKRFAGKPAGWPRPDGSLDVRLNYTLYRVHRLVWLLAYGFPPPDQIDHKNGNPSDNHPENLREATNTENSYNLGAHKDNKLGLKGVSYLKREKKYRANICVGGKQKSLGYFDTPEEAKAARDKAARELHGEFFHA